MTAIARTAALCLGGCLALAACSPQVAADQPGGGPIAGVGTGTTTTTTSNTTSNTTSSTTSSTTTSTTPAVDRTTTTTRAPSVTAASVLAEFKALVRKHCAPAYTGGDTHVPMPTAKSAQLKSGSKWLVRDDENIDQMLFDRATGIVTSKQGPDGSLPQVYVFECDPEVFISPVS